MNSAVKSLQEIRERLGCTQAELARLLSVSRSTISMMEQGERNLPSAAWKVLIQMLEQLRGPETDNNLADRWESEMDDIPLNNIHLLLLQKKEHELHGLQEEWVDIFDRREKSLHALRTLSRVQFSADVSRREGKMRQYDALVMKQRLQLSTCTRQYQIEMRLRIAGLKAEIDELRSIIVEYSQG